MRVLSSIAFLSLAESRCEHGWKAATWTYYNSYPACCPDNPNYDPKAPTNECDDYSGCKYSGDFAYINHKSFKWVKSHNIIAFYSMHLDNHKYAGKTMRVSALDKTFEVQVADTCGDLDCAGCCTKNAIKHGGYLVDMEGYTVMNNYGGTGEEVFGGESKICWQLVDEEEEQSPSPAPAGGCEDGYTAATWTYYNSYPACCPDNPNYDPKAPTDECDDYSGCKYSGDFEYIGHKSFNWVTSNNIVAFYSTHGDTDKYGGKTLRVSALDKTFEVQVADTCGDADCDGCCTKNANKHGGYLVDMEGYTVINNYGGTGEEVFGGQSKICWQLVDEEAVV